jgi:hypothetical protein
MAHERNNLVLEHLRAIRSEFGEFRVDLKDVKGRLTSLEVSVANSVAKLPTCMGTLPVNRAESTESRTGSNGSSAA